MFIIISFPYYEDGSTMWQTPDPLQALYMSSDLVGYMFICTYRAASKSVIVLNCTLYSMID